MNTIEQDYLTGLANRRGLYDHYDSLDRESSLHAMFIDIDNFKRVNDIYGHSMGDKLLVEIGHLIQRSSTGFVSRIGGDEYVVLLKGDIQQTEIEQMAKDLIENMPHIDFRADILSLISLSVGIVFDQSASQPLDDILAKCDAAMYQAKYDGKNRYTVYQTFDKTIEISRNIEAEMEDALKNGEFEVYLQPKVNMISSCLCGAEALSRWIHPLDGLRPPIAYIPLFEKNGFISQLDMYVYEQVCKIKASWAGQPYEHIPVSVNMSRLHLYNKNFVTELEDIAKKYGIPNNELELEITESTFIKDNAELIRVIDFLHSRGFLVSIDDFGSGYSALNLLKDLAVDTVKLDKEFLQVSSNSNRGKKVIRSVIMMCRELKIDVVTEGIETQEHVDFIVKCGCQIAQGFFYSKPLPIDEFLLFANEYINNSESNYIFRLNGSLQSEDGSLEGTIRGSGFEYRQGIFSDSKALHFPGGETDHNVVFLPADTIINDSFTISMWIRPEQLIQWTAAMYIRCETGFYSLVPFAWEGHSCFRNHISSEINGWHDVSAVWLQANYWWHFVVSYNVRTEIASIIINGEVLGQLKNTPANHLVKLIELGGDIFQPSFVGDICELMIFNEVKDYEFIKELHNSYIMDEKFVGGPIREVV